MRVFSWLQCLATLGVALFIAADPAGADSLEPLKGKTIRAMIGSSAGGTNDVVLRGFFDSMQAVLPQTTIRVQNVSGSGGAKAIKELQEAGGNLVTLATFNNAPLFAQLASHDAMPYDLNRVVWIGAIRKTPRVLGVRNALGVSSVEQLKATGRQPLIGAGDALNTSTLNSYLLNALLGLKFRVITGMAEADENAMLLAGDLDAKQGGLNELSLQFESGLLRPILTLTAERLPGTLQSVPSVGELASERVSREMVSLFETLNNVNSLVAASPATRPEVVQAVRTAFDLAVARPEFVAFMDRHRLTVEPTPGLALESQLVQLFSSSSTALVDRFRSLIDCGKQISDGGAKDCR